MFGFSSTTITLVGALMVFKMLGINGLLQVMPRRSSWDCLLHRRQLVAVSSLLMS
ncbi:unnamed protein product [Linum tenue]|uniref:Uncharacterized protein n=1 Tax=Linum tenue TaxID=586396 RepID=A0AAV0M9S3_9ROSI|nr:unnamed protein product [Linum tenue]